MSLLHNMKLCHDFKTVVSHDSLKFEWTTVLTDDVYLDSQEQYLFVHEIVRVMSTCH